MLPKAISIHSLVAVFRPFHAVAILSYLLVSAIALPLPAAAQASGRTAPHTQTVSNPIQAKAELLAQPLGFEPNRGQAETGVDFVSRGRGYSLLLSGNESTFVAAGDHSSPVDRSIHMKLVGADAAVKPHAEKPLPGQSNYLMGNDPSRWVHGVQQFQQVRLANAYPGIDLLYYGNQKQVEHDFIVSAGVDPHQIRMQFSGAAAQIISEHGDLQLKTRSGSTVSLVKPVAYQQLADGSRHIVAADYATSRDNTVGFQLGDYDRSLPLVIDPVVITYSTYFGGTNQDSVVDLKLDAAGNIYVLMSTDSTDLPVVSQIAGACVGTCGPKNPDTASASSLNFTLRDFYLAKLDPTGQKLLFSTYIGGSDDDVAGGLSIASDGAIYIAGETKSTDFPLVNQYSRTPASTYTNGYPYFSTTVTRLSTDGSAILYSSLIGGGLINFGGGNGGRYDGTSTGSIAAGPNGIVYLLGYAETANGGGGSGNFVDAKNTSYTVGLGTFLAKFDTTKTAGDSLVYATTFGQPGDQQSENLWAVALDSKQNVWLFGNGGDSHPTPTPNAVQPVCGNGGQCGNAYLYELNPAGSIVYASFLGGTMSPNNGVPNEMPLGIAIDASDNVYLTGGTNSIDFPTTTNAATPTNTSGSGGFLTKLSPGGLSILYSTYTPLAFHLAVTPGGIAGGVSATTSGFPVKNGLASQNGGPTSDTVFQLYDTTQSGDASLLASSYLGSTFFTIGQTAAFDPAGQLLFGGYTESGTLPLVNPYQSTCSGGCYSAGNYFPDGFITRVQFGANTGAVTLLPATLSFPNTAVESTSAVLTSTLKNTTSSAFAFTPSFTNSTDFKETDDCNGMVAANSTCTFSFTFAPQSAAALTSTFTLTGTTTPATTLSVALSGTGTGLPVLTIAPNTYSFGSVASGSTPPTQTLVLKNTGNVTDNAVTFKFTESDQGTQTLSLAYTDNCTSLAVGATCNIVVTFTPHAGVAATGTLTVNGNAGVTPAVATITGTGTGAAAATLSTTSFNFGPVTDGTTTPGTTFTLSNTGATSLTVSSIAISGSGAAAFAVVPGSSTCGTAFAANAACVFSVTFSPTAATPYTATVNIIDQAGTQTLTLTGTGVTQPALTLSPSTINFGSLGVGAVSAPQTLTLTNPGTAAVPIPLPGINEAVRNFETPDASTGTCDALKTLAGGASCTYQVQFEPIAAGPATGTYVIFDTSNSKQLPATVALTGTGVAQPALTLSPSTINFGPLGVGAASAPQTLTLHNPGTAAVAIPLPGINEAVRNFEQPDSGSGTCATLKTLAAGASCTYLEQFAPIAAGPATATFVIFDTATSKQLPATVAFTGTGVAQPPLTLSPSTINFGPLGVGAASAPQTLTLHNPGTAAVAIPLPGINETVRNFEEPDGSSGTCATLKTLAAGASCTYLEQFEPIVAGPATATFVIFDTATSKQLPATVAFTGTGVAQSLTFTPSSFAFGSVAVGNNVRQVFTLANGTSSPVSITGYSSTGDLNTEFLLGGSCGAPEITSLAPGTSCVIVITFAPQAAGSYTGSISLVTSSGPQTVTFTGQGTATASPDFTFTATAGNSLSVGRGLSGTIPFQVASVDPTNPFTSPVTFSASGLPAGVAVTFSPATITPGASGGTTTMTVKAPTSTASAKPSSPFSPQEQESAFGISAAALIAGLFGFRRKLSVRLLLCLCALGLVAGAMSGCGVTSSTLYSTTNIFVTATSGSTVHSVTVLLTLN